MRNSKSISKVDQLLKKKSTMFTMNIITTVTVVPLEFLLRKQENTVLVSMLKVYNSKKMLISTFQLRSCCLLKISSTLNISASLRKTKLLFLWVLPTIGVSSMVLLNGNHGVKLMLTLK